jgi:Tol biopolymer transport system component
MIQNAVKSEVDMHYNKVKMFLGWLLVITSIITVGFTQGRETSMQDGDMIYYLSQANDSIYRIIMPNSDKADLVFAPPKEQPGEKYEISGLTCGLYDTLLFHVTHTTGLVADFSNTKTKMTIAVYDLVSKKFRTFVDLGDTSTLFPIISPDGSKLAMSGVDGKHNDRFLIIKDLKNGSVKYHDTFTTQGLTPQSWSPDGKILAMSGVDSKTNKQHIYFFDSNSGKVTSWMHDGGMPIFSPSGQFIAYSSPDQRKLIISTIDGKTKQSFDGYLVKNINAWIGENKVLFTIGHFMYENHIGIADLEKKIIYDIKVPAKGEINGICYKPKLN